MSKRHLSLLCAGLFVVAACGDADDPSKNNTTANNANNVNNVNNVNNMNNVNNVNNTNNVNNVNNVNNTNNVNNVNNVNNTNNMTECMLLTDFTGQVAGDGVHEGGTPDFDGSVTGDAGLQAVYDAAPAQSDDMDTPDVDEGRVEGLDIQVSEALVVATTFDMFANNTFWVQDENLAMRVRLDNGTEQSVNIAVGQRVSFGVEAVLNFGGVPQIAQFTGDVTVDSDGNDVPIREATGTPVTIDDFGKLVRVWGTIEGAGEPCGGDNNCFDFVHGEGTETTTFRTGSTFIEDGTCLTFVGPVSAFPGPLSEGADRTIQLDQTNFDWAFEPRN